LENISPVYARFVLRELTGRGIEASRVLAGTTLDLERLETGGDISVGDFVTILDNGRKLGDDERLGLMIGRHCNPLTLGPVGAAMANAPTVREGLQAMENYSRLHASYIGVTVQSNLEGLSIKIDFLQDLRDTERFHSESAVMMLQNYVETLTGRLLDDATYRFSFPRPEYAAEYALCMHSPVAFDCKYTSIELPRHWLELKSPYFHVDMWRQAQLKLSEKIREFGANNERAYTQYLTSLMQSQDPPLPDLASIADSLHLSERTLTRRLKQEGASYREIRNKVLNTWARQYLMHTSDSVESIAASLGYQDAANFRRAFRNREGCSPREFRERASTADKA
jgi:AraC-like DNA-binding protein